MNQSITEVVDKNLDKLSGAMQEAATALQQVAPHAWDVMVRQQVIEACTYLTAWFTAGFVLLWISRTALKSAKTEKDKYVRGSTEMLGYIFAALGGAALLAGSTMNVPTLFNPEYYAAKDMVELIAKINRSHCPSD